MKTFLHQLNGFCSLVTLTLVLSAQLIHAQNTLSIEENVGQQYGIMDGDHYYLSNTPSDAGIFWTQPMEAPSGHTFGHVIARTNAIAGYVWGQIGCQSYYPYPPVGGAVWYSNIPNPAGDTIWIKFRYSKYSEPIRTIKIYWNSSLVGEFQPQNTYNWNTFTTSAYIALALPPPAAMLPPLNLSALVAGTNVTLTWEEPAPSQGITGYNVYKDGEIIAANSPGLVYSASNVLTGSHYFGVSSVYSQGESERADIQTNIGKLKSGVQGFVKDASTKSPVMNACLWADTDYGATSDSTVFGSHFKMFLPPGTYSVECSAPGYQPLTKSVIVSDMLVSESFYLNPDPSSDRLQKTISSGETNNETTLEIFPNPATEEVCVQSEHNIKKLMIINGNGQPVYTNDSVNSSNIKLNTGVFSKGIYLVRCVFDNEKVENKTLIIQ